MSRQSGEEHDVPGWPVIRISLGRDPRTGLPELTVGNEPVDVPTGGDPRTLAIAVVAREAQRLGRPVRALAVDEDGSWPLIVHPDGATSDPPAGEPRRRLIMPAPRARSGRAPTGLIAGIAGLLLLLSLAAGAIAVTTTGARTPTSTAIAPTEPAPDPLPPGTAAPPTAPPASPAPTAPAPTTTSPSTPESAAAQPPRTAATPQPRSRPNPRPTPPTRTRAPRTPTPAQPVVGPLVNGLGHCLTGSPDGSAVWTTSCEPGNPSQSWTTTPDGTLRQGTKCVSTAATGPGVGIIPCTSGSTAQRWTPASTPGHLVNATAGLCLAELLDGTAAAVPCAPQSPAQAWTRKT